MRRRLLSLVACAALLPACANHVRYSSDAFETRSRDVVHVATLVEPQTVLDTPALELELLADQTAVVRRMRTRVRFDESTPYKSGHELWEVPVGVVCVPLLVVARVVDFVGFGLVPDKSLDEFAGFGFSALNPLLNTESRSRVRKREVSRETEELDREVTRQLEPLAGAAVSLAIDARAARTFHSDARGRVRLELLELAPDTLPGRPRALRVTIEAEGERERHAVELPIAHSLSARLTRALESRSRAQAPGATPEQIGRSLAELDALGFSASALALETELRARPGANAAWLARLESAMHP